MSKGQEIRKVLKERMDVENLALAHKYGVQEIISPFYQYTEGTELTDKQKRDIANCKAEQAKVEAHYIELMEATRSIK